MRRQSIAVAILALLLTACTAGVEGSPASSPSVIPGSASMTPAPSPSATPAGFASSISPLVGQARRHVLQQNWHHGCPVPLGALRLVRVRYWDFHGDVRTGPLVLNERVAADVVWVFRRLFRARFPIHRIDLSPHPRPIDWNSTRNLTSSFNCRSATGNPGVLSQHSYGWAIDINPLQNPYVRSDGSVLRAAARPYRDRARERRGMIRPGDIVVRSFAAIGWGWGGNWHTIKDYMHFSLTGT